MKNSPPEPQSAKEPQIDPETGQRTWTAGTLRYTKGGLYLLFFWLMWNDFCLTLMENVAPALTPLLFKDHGATNKEISFYMATLGPMLTIWINPVFSTWSDRVRTRFGRRRPFLLVATPFAAVLLAAIPWAPKLFHWAMQIPWFASIFGGGSFNGAVLFLGIFVSAFSLFNTVILSIFSYYYWDVVPESVLGRFNAIARIVTTLVSFIWNYFLFGLADTHMEELFAGLAGLFLLIYFVSVWKVKEGEYPPPDCAQGRSIVAMVTGYFRDTFSSSRFLWIFAGFTLYQVGNLANLYRIFHWRDSLGLSLDTIGKMQSFPQLAIVLLVYPIGALIDRMKPVRMMAPALVFWATCNFAAFFFLNNQWALLVYIGLITIAASIFGICHGTIMVEIFPREKLGQFASASSLAQQVFCFFLAIGVGTFFDWVRDYSYVYLWSAVFHLLAAAVFVKVYWNWKAERKLREQEEREFLAAAQVANASLLSHNYLLKKMKE